MCEIVRIMSAWDLAGARCDLVVSLQDSMTNVCGKVVRIERAKVAVRWRGCLGDGTFVLDAWLSIVDGCSRRHRSGAEGHESRGFDSSFGESLEEPDAGLRNQRQARCG